MWIRAEGRVVRVEGLTDAADDRCPAVANHQTGAGLPRLNRGTRRTFRGGTRLVLLQRNIHDHRSRLGDLRDDGGVQRRVDVSDRGREVDPRLERDLEAA